MSKKLKIAIVTGSRSEFGILSPLIRLAEEDKDVDSFLFVTGSHLALSQGDTASEIEEMGLNIYKKLPILLDGDKNIHMALAMGLGMISFSQSLEELRPDIMVILGDRFEIFSAASAAMALEIPIAHIGGGETDFANCLDGNIRNAITKLAAVHFVSNALYEKRVKAMGEEPCRVINTGMPSIDGITKNLLSKEELEKSLNIKLESPVFLITYLPVGLEREQTFAELNALFEALTDIEENYTAIFTLANADASGRRINEKIRTYAKTNDKVKVFQNLGRKRYLSAINCSSVVIGNSSSGVIETPSFKKPAVNIGQRQKGRIHPANVIDTQGERREIADAIKKALYDKEFAESLKELKNPFGDGNASAKILNTLKNLTYDRRLIEKKLIILSN